MLGAFAFDPLDLSARALFVGLERIQRRLQRGGIEMGMGEGLLYPWLYEYGHDVLAPKFG